MRAWGSTLHTDGGRDDEGLVESAGPGDALEGLHNFAEADGQAVEGELGPGIERLGRKGALAPLWIGDVVVGLLDVGAGEKGRGGRGVVGGVDGEDGIGDGRGWIDWRRCILLFHSSPVRL